jgi:Nucleotidyl transferase AbiEii toxin, Type IV TA system
MTPLLETAQNLQEFLVGQHWRFWIIGGIALLRWGEPRYTRDVDVTLYCGFGKEADFGAPLLSAGYRGRISDAAAFAVRNRVLLLESIQGIPIDVALGALPFEETMIDRSSIFEFAPDCRLRTCSAEDLIVLKLFAFRTRDVLDVETIVIRQRGVVDWSYIEPQLAPLADVKEQPQIMDTLAALRKLR